MFRLNEVIESYITARLALVQSQYVCDEFSAISNQTSLVNLLDYSASNIYVGLLKTAYKEAFSALDKIAILVNHYLSLGISESQCYYGTVWYEHNDEGKPREPRVIASKVRDQGYRLFGLYLLCDELCGSQYSSIRNALTHRYVRVYKHVGGPKGSHLFEDLTETTVEVLYKVKCAIMYAALFIWEKERASGRTGPSVDIPLSTEQHLDLWERSDFSSSPLGDRLSGASLVRTIQRALLNVLRRRVRIKRRSVP